MVGEEIPARVVRFLETCIDSIEQLRVLLLLHSCPSREWTVTEMTAELRSSEASIAKRLDDLYQRKVLDRPVDPAARHRFNPITTELRDVIAELAHENEVRPYRLIDAIYSKPDKGLQEFADAFKIRGDNT